MRFADLRAAQTDAYGCVASPVKTHEGHPKEEEKQNAVSDSAGGAA